MIGRQQVAAIAAVAQTVDAAAVAETAARMLRAEMGPMLAGATGQATAAQAAATTAQQQASATAAAVTAMESRVAALDTRVTELAAQVAALAARKVHVVTGRAAVPAVALGVSRDVAITWTAPAPTAPTGTAVIFEPAGQLLGGATAVVKSVTTTGCVVTLTAAVAVALGQGWVKVVGVALA